MPGEFGDSTRVVPIREKDLRIGIDEAAMGCTEHAGAHKVAYGLAAAFALASTNCLTG